MRKTFAFALVHRCLSFLILSGKKSINGKCLLNGSSALVMMVLLLPTADLRGQDMNNIIPPSPEAAKLAQFGFTPVSLYRGTHNLSIPLHAIDFYGLQIPISLSYYSGGIRANEDAGLIGLGWTLNHTGVISRVVMGRDDLYKKNAFGFPSGNLADGYVYDTTPVPTVDSDYNSQAYRDFFISSDASNIVSGQKDTEPDVFTLSLFGISTKFVLGKISNGEVEVIKLSEDANKIEFNESDQTFTVTTSEGFVAEFNKKARSTNVTGSDSGASKWNSCAANIDYLGAGGLYYEGRMRNISSWYLSEIKSPTGRKINFNYDIVGNDKSEYVSVSAASFGSKYSFVTSASGSVLNINDAGPPATAVGSAINYLVLRKT